MSAESDLTAALAAELAFTRASDVTRDPGGRLRARTIDPASMTDPRVFDRRPTAIYDLARPDAPPPELSVQGFAQVDLSRLGRAQAALERVRVAGHVGAADAARIRRALVGRVLRLTSGERLLLLFIAGEGFIMRRAGPGGERLPGLVDERLINGHDGAVSVHADQDVDGTPLRQILGGAAPWVFRHDSPDHHNHRSPLLLINLWIPLEQVTRPLALMDTRTLDRRAHQLRYGLPTDGILQRSAGRRINDIWTFLPDAGQRWYFSSAIDARTAYVFETLSTPHASFIIPGEARAAALRGRLLAAIEALTRGDAAAAIAALDVGDAQGQAPATASLAAAIASMEATIAEGRARLAAGDIAGDGWSERAAAAAERVVRKSIEMRGVALRLRRRR